MTIGVLTKLHRTASQPRVNCPGRGDSNQVRPTAIGRNNWLFAGSLLAGQRAAAVMSLLHSAKLNEHDPYAYLKDALTRLPMQLAARIERLLPHQWQPTDAQ